MKTQGGYLIGRIKLLSGRILNKLLHENRLNDFSSEQGKILYTLWQKDGICSTTLSKETGLALNTLTNMLEHMEKSGLLYRRSCDQDRRKKRVYLTEKGKMLEEKTGKINQQMDAIFYKGFSREEIADFEEKLGRIVSNLMEVEK